MKIQAKIENKKCEKCGRDMAGQVQIRLIAGDMDCKCKRCRDKEAN